MDVAFSTRRLKGYARRAHAARGTTMTMQRRSPDSEVATLRNIFDRFFDESGWAGSAEGRLPLDIMGSEDAITIEAALPGIPPDDVDITVHQDTLTISVQEGSRETDQDGERIYREMRRSHGSRTITLPSGLDVDNAEATFENGLLRLVLPRGEESKPRQIRIGQKREG
jgi:HSP20 family protein